MNTHKTVLALATLSARSQHLNRKESEKAGNCRKSKPGHLACTASALPLSLVPRQFIKIAWVQGYLPLRYNDQTTTSPQSSISTTQVRLQCLSHTPGSHSVCTIQTPWGLTGKLSISIRRESMLSGFLTLSAQILASHLKSKRFLYVMRQNKVKRPAVTGN